MGINVFFVLLNYDSNTNWNDTLNMKLKPLIRFVKNTDIHSVTKNVSGYVCNHGSPSGERDTASPRGRYGERLQRDSCLKIHM